MPSVTSRTPPRALDEVLVTALEWERQDYQGAIEGIRRGYEAVKAGNTGPPPTSWMNCARSMALEVRTTADAEWHSKLPRCFPSQIAAS